MSPFDHTKFIGYVCDVTPQFVRIQIPSAKLVNSFYLNGNIFMGASVGSYVIIEGNSIGFLGKIFELNLPQGERKELTEKDFTEGNPLFHPMGKVELLAIFDHYRPFFISKTVSKFPIVGAKVFSCSVEQMGQYISSFGKGEEDCPTPIVPFGELTSNKCICSLSINSLFQRHCAVLGTTGGGKSWTVAKLVELMTKHTSNKCIVVDATGEYSSLDQYGLSISMGNREYYYDYRNLSIDELYFLLHPSSKIQVPKLMEAIRSLKMISLDEKNHLSQYYEQDSSGNQFLIKAGRQKRAFQEFYYKNIVNIENNSCNFEFTSLPHQITQECIWDSGIAGHWGNRNDNDVANCISLISRVNNIMSTSEYNNIFGFRKTNTSNSIDLREIIEEFLSTESSSSLLRIDFSNVSFDYQVREILVNSIGQYLLNQARNGKFKEAPIVVFMDEAHQFLNKKISDEYFTSKPLDAFEKISKEARKYGLFLCIATQMPRDIPIGTLSQIGTFIVHRLINEQDKRAVEAAVSTANNSNLAFLPILGEGEALLASVDFPMPITLKIYPPEHKPNSRTPKLR